MSKIKTRETVHDIKILDKSVVAGERMKDAFIRTKKSAENVMDDGYESPSEYAGDKIQYAMEDTARETTHKVTTTTKDAVNKGREAYKEHKKTQQLKKEAEKKLEEVRKETHTVAEQAEGGVRQHVAKTQRAANKTSKSTVKQSEKAIKQTAKSTGKATVKTTKGTIKATGKSIKTAEQTSRAAIKTAENTAKTAQKAAKASAKAAQAAARAAKAAAKAAAEAAKVAAKAVAAAVKAIIAAVKGLIAAIAAGGWVAVIVIVVICIIGLIVGSVFGIFFSSEDNGSEKTMQQVVREINDDYQNQLTSIKSSITYDDLELSGSSAVWPEVLSVYAVRTTSDPDNPQEVATLDDNKIMLLKSIFWEMNEINFRTETHSETVIIESDDGNGNIVEEETTETKTTLYITVTHKTADQMAAEYSFTDDQKAQLAELLDSKNKSLWAAVLYGIHDGDAQIVAVALSQIGNQGGEPYWSWYGFNSRVEWCACFVSWCANECGYIDDGIIPKYAGCVNGVNWFRERGQWADNTIEPVPGMIIFFDWDSPNGESGPQDGESDHTGIVEKVEDGWVYTVEGNTSDGCHERKYQVGYYEILGYGIPAY